MNVRRVTHGVYGGLAGGAVFGVMMGAMGMLPMIGSMVGVPSAWAGFIVHMGVSAMIGASVGVALGLVGGRAGALTGLAYGATWWVLGPLTLMPLFMGMGFGVNWSVDAATAALPSLVGHLMFGLVLGVTHGWLDRRDPESLRVPLPRTA